MAIKSLLKDGSYSLKWVKDFYAQTGIWWGPHIQSDKAHAARLDMIERLCGAGPLRILELGSGPGETAARLADKGHAVVGVELNPTDAAHADLISRTPRPGSFTAIQADWYSVRLDGRFDVVCCWEAFGLGGDPDQRRLLHRIAREWLGPCGSALLDVYCPFAPAKDAGVVERLPPLPGVPGSVEMNRRSYFDPIECRWIEDW
ncbi:MAG: SAM-dependent methyltransferase, partial [Rudaea sp.]